MSSTRRLLNSIILTFSGRLGFLLAFYARLFVMLSLANFLLNAGLGAASLKTAQSAVQSLIVFYDYA